MKELWTQRIVSGTEQHWQDPINSFYRLSDSLLKNNILLNRSSLSNLAIFEPASFEALAKIALHFKKDEEN
jgi:large subunit ribosomal protein L20